MKHILSFTPRPLWAGLLTGFSLILAACGPSTAAVSAPSFTPALSATGTQAATPAGPAASPQVSIPETGSAAVLVMDQPGFGKVLATSDGRTLYSNSVDSAGQILCADSACTDSWPPYLVSAEPTAGAGIPGTLGTVTRPDGTLQLTYNQKPLYTFHLDQAPGDVKGDGISDLGGVWHVVPPVSATPENSPAPLAPTSGYDRDQY